MTLKEVVEQFHDYLVNSNRSWETISGYMKNLRYFSDFMYRRYNCQVYLEDISSTDLEHYLHYLLTEKKYSSASRKRALAIMRSFYSFCLKKKLCPVNITSDIEGIKCEQKERVYLSEEEVELLISAIENPLMRLVVQFLYYTGLRISECINLKLEDVDLQARIIHVVMGKGRKSRIVPINHKLMELLNDYLDNWRLEQGSTSFFCTSSGSLSRSYVDCCIRQASTRSGLNKVVSPHILRHSFASSLVQKDVNISRVQKLLGHSSLNTTSIYIHANMQELKQAVDRL